MKVMVIPIVIGALDTVSKELVQGHRNKSTGGNYPNYSIVKIGQNTEESPGDSSEKSSANTDAKNSQEAKC